MSKTSSLTKVVYIMPNWPKNLNFMMNTENRASATINFSASYAAWKSLSLMIAIGKILSCKSILSLTSIPMQINTRWTSRTTGKKSFTHKQFKAPQTVRSFPWLTTIHQYEALLRTYVSPPTHTWKSVNLHKLEKSKIKRLPTHDNEWKGLVASCLNCI